MKSLVAIQDRQSHCGFICTDSDQNEMRYHDRFKTIVLNNKLMHMSIRDEFEERLIDREQILHETRQDEEDGKGPVKTAQGLTLWETRKITETNINEMKLRMHEHIQKKT